MCGNCFLNQKQSFGLAPKCKIAIHQHWCANAVRACLQALFDQSCGNSLRHGKIRRVCNAHFAAFRGNRFLGQHAMGKRVGDFAGTYYAFLRKRSWNMRFKNIELMFGDICKGMFWDTKFFARISLGVCANQSVSRNVESWKNCHCQRRGEIRSRHLPALG